MNTSNNEKILVTGGAGFIGSALVRELLNRNYRVFIYDNFIYGDQSNIIDISDSIIIYKGDILSWNFFNVVKKCKPDYIFNLAAEPYIPHCYDNPEKFFDVNVLGTMNVLKATKLFDVKKIIHFSSSEVYGTSKYVPMDENHPTLPLSTYAVSKLSADRICHVWAYEHEIPVVILRPFNCYGPRETQPYVIPEIITQLTKSNEIMLGNINAQRDFTYVEDTVKCAVALLSCNVMFGDVFNIGSNKVYSIEELVYLVGELLNIDDIKIIIDKKRLRPLDVDKLQCDYSKIRSLTDWRPNVDIKDGLKNTINWYNENGKMWPWEKLVKGTIITP